MQYETARSGILAFLFILSTYAFARSLWIFGVRGKVKKFVTFWGAVSLFMAGIACTVGLVVLSQLL